MKRVIAIILVMSVMFGVSSVFAAQGGQKGASSKAYENVSDEAVFHRVGDWFATIGKSEEDKNVIIAERKAKRAAQRVEKEAQKQQKKIEKQMKKSQENMNETMKGMKKSMGNK